MFVLMEELEASTGGLWKCQNKVLRKKGDGASSRPPPERNVVSVTTAGQFPTLLCEQHLEDVNELR